MKLAEAASGSEDLEAKVDNLVAECLKTSEENVNLKELVICTGIQLFRERISKSLT